MFDKYQHPGRYTRKIGDVGMKRAVGYGFHFGFELAHQSDFLAWYANVVDQRVYVLYQDGGQVAHQTMIGV